MDQTVYVEADASASGMAAILSQKDNDTSQKDNDDTGRLQPINCYSSALSASQKNNSAGRLEAWAIVSAARKWSVYLRAASEFIFLTDHCPLQWLCTKRASGDWSTNIKYAKVRSGDSASYKADQVSGYGPRWSTKEGTKGLELKGEALCFKGRLVVPREIQGKVLAMVHNETHFGQVGTLEALRRNFFWAKMSRDTKQFCRSCVVCHRAKPCNRHRQPIERMSLGGDFPGSAVAVDIGTLPWADGEFRYFLLMVDLFTRLVG